MAPSPEAGRVREIRRRLLAFFDRSRRDLPWRRDPDPYRVWVSEVMLQQTRVETVVPYFERWVERFPSIGALAAADLDEVLSEWAGLGYYGRARRLHAAARTVRDRLGGELPDTAAGLRALPGVGEYTAGAVASIAFGRRVPAVDGNARRVLTRIFDLEDPSPAELRRVADRLVPHRRPGDFNQALMDLGATVCLPSRPDCPRCPLAGPCRALARGTVAERPGRRPRRPVPTFDLGTALVVSPASRVLVARRPEDGLLGGMWEFPGAVAGDGGSPADAAAGVAVRLVGAAARRALAGETSAKEGAETPQGGARGGSATGRTSSGRVAPRAEPATRRMATDAEPLVRVDHAFTHRRHVYHAFLFAVDAEPVPPPDERWTAVEWVSMADLDALPLSAAQRTIGRALADRAGPS